MNKLILKADSRVLSGRKVKQLRSKGIVPGNIFGRHFKSQSIQVEEKEFLMVFKTAGETGLVEIEIGKEKKPVLIHNLQKDPVSNNLLHVDFLQVDLKQKVSAMVPVVLTGESPAEKQSLGTIVQYITELEVEALPEDLPDKFEIDITGLSDVDQAILVKNIKVDTKKVEIDKDQEEVVVKVEPQKEEKVEEALTPTEEVKEGETPVEGATKSETGDTEPSNKKEEK